MQFDRQLSRVPIDEGWGDVGGHFAELSNEDVSMFRPGMSDNKT